LTLSGQSFTIGLKAITSSTLTITPDHSDIDNDPLCLRVTSGWLRDLSHQTEPSPPLDSNLNRPLRISAPVGSHCVVVCIASLDLARRVEISVRVAQNDGTNLYFVMGLSSGDPALHYLSHQRMVECLWRLPISAPRAIFCKRVGEEVNLTIQARLRRLHDHQSQISIMFNGPHQVKSAGFDQVEDQSEVRFTCKSVSDPNEASPSNIKEQAWHEAFIDAMFCGVVPFRRFAGFDHDSP